MKTHIFGELDLDLSKGPGRIYDEAFEISEQCGYMVSLGKSVIIVEGTDGDVAKIKFNRNEQKHFEIKVELYQVSNDKLVLVRNIQ
jgi:hypothetical protein